MTAQTEVRLPDAVAADLHQTAQDERQHVSAGWGRLYTGLLSCGLSRPLAQSLWLLGQETNRLRRKGKAPNGCIHPGKAGLARVFRASESTAKRHVAQLRELALVELVEQGGGHGGGHHGTRPGQRRGKGLANVLRLTPLGWSVLAARSVVENAQEKRGGKRCPKGGHFDPPDREINLSEKEVAPHAAAAAALPGSVSGAAPAGRNPSATPPPFALRAPGVVAAPYAAPRPLGGREALRRAQPVAVGGTLKAALSSADPRTRVVVTHQTRPANYSPTPRRDPEADAAPWAKYLRDPVPGSVVVDVDSGSHVLTRCPCDSCRTWRAYAGKALPGENGGAS